VYTKKDTVRESAHTHTHTHKGREEVKRRKSWRNLYIRMSDISRLQQKRRSDQGR